MVTEAVTQALRHVLAQLQECGARTAVMGGIAVAAWNWMRTTKDVDILIGVETGDVASLLDKFEAAGIRRKRSPAIVAVGDHQFVQLIYEPPGAFIDIQIDLLLASSDFHKTALERAVPITLPAIGQEVSVVACEDLIVLKLLAGRLIDQADAAALLRVNREAIDMGHLGKWIRNLGLQSEFRTVWNEALPSEAPPLG